MRIFSKRRTDLVSWLQIERPRLFELFSLAVRELFSFLWLDRTNLDGANEWMERKTTKESGSTDLGSVHQGEKNNPSFAIDLVRIVNTAEVFLYLQFCKNIIVPARGNLQWCSLNKITELTKIFSAVRFQAEWKLMVYIMSLKLVSSLCSYIRGGCIWRKYSSLFLFTHPQARSQHILVNRPVYKHPSSLATASPSVPRFTCKAQKEMLSS